MTLSEPPGKPITLKIGVTGVILAGGQGSRMGGEDKGWIPLEGVPLIKHVIARLRPQVDNILIVANRNVAAYRQLGYRVIEDCHKGFNGPLAGIHSALAILKTPLALVVPTDAPFLPENLLARLMQNRPADENLDHPLLCNDGQREQPLFGVYPALLTASLDAFLASGERKLMRWCRENHAEWIDFSGQADDFANLNTPDDLVVATSTKQ